jgi:hypothetical protein
MMHPRLRRTSPISQYAAGVAFEALGSSAENTSARADLGIVYCVRCGCVNHSRRFFDEVLKDPRTASPLLFPETVLNAPASHLATLLGISGATTTLVGDDGAFLQGVALGANWVVDGRVKRCLIVGAEEIDWLTAEAACLFDKDLVLSGGAGAVLVGGEPTECASVKLQAITTPVLFHREVDRVEAGIEMRRQLNSISADLLCDGLRDAPKSDRAEAQVWRDWQGARISVKRYLGESFSAGASWQCVAALDLMLRGLARRAIVSVMGGNEQAVAAVFSS